MNIFKTNFLIFSQIFLKIKKISIAPSLLPPQAESLATALCQWRRPEWARCLNHENVRKSYMNVKSCFYFLIKIVLNFICVPQIKMLGRGLTISTYENNRATNTIKWRICAHQCIYIHCQNSLICKCRSSYQECSYSWRYWNNRWYPTRTRQYL